MTNLSETRAERGVGRLRMAGRNLGCVGYALDRASATFLVQLDPMPSAVAGDVLELTLEEGRILECRVLGDTYCTVLDGAAIERRHGRRPTPTARAFL